MAEGYSTLWQCSITISGYTMAAEVYDGRRARGNVARQLVSYGCYGVG